MSAAADTADPAPSDQSTAETDWPSATKQVRDTADWIVKAFVALATVLIGTGPLLVNLGDLALDVRSAVAVLGAVLALGAVGYVIWAASDVKLTEVTDITELDAAEGNVTPTARLLNRLAGSPAADSLYLLNRGSIDGLIELRTQNVDALRSQRNALAVVDSDADRKLLMSLVELSQAGVSTVDDALRNLEGWATYEEVRARFDERRPRMFVAAAAAALGVGLWLGGLGIDVGDDDDGDAASPAATALPPGSVAVLAWSNSGTVDRDELDELRNALGMSGDACDEVGVVIEGGGGDPVNPWQVSVLPNDPCSARVRFTTDRRFATVELFEAGDNPKHVVTIESDEWWEHQAPWLIVGIGFLIGAASALIVYRRAGTRR